MCGDSTEISHNKFIAFSVYNSFLSNVYVVVNLLCQVIFVFLLFWGMGYGNGADEDKTREK